MTEMFGEAWSPMSVPDLAPDDDEIIPVVTCIRIRKKNNRSHYFFLFVNCGCLYSYELSVVLLRNSSLFSILLERVFCYV